METPQVKTYKVKSYDAFHQGISYHCEGMEGMSLLTSIQRVLDHILQQEGWNYRKGVSYSVWDENQLSLIVCLEVPEQQTFLLKHGGRLCFSGAWFVMTASELSAFFKQDVFPAILYNGWDMDICTEFIHKTRPDLANGSIKGSRDTFRSDMFITGIDNKVPVNSYLVALSETLTWVVPKKVFETLFQEVKI